MIKLIATDIDGTLIQDSTAQLYPEIVEEIRRLTDQGVLFVGASGRQYASIRNVFQDVAKKIVVIAENGAHIRYQGRNLALTEMRRELAVELIGELRQLEGCEMVVSTPEGSLLETDNREFLAMMTYGYHNVFRVVPDVLSENLPILKVAVYRPVTIRRLGETKLIPAWRDRLQVCVAGEQWVDFMDSTVDKGNALRMVQKYFGITQKETMVFGDNTNDIGLMKAAGESYAVENARPEVKQAAKYICPSWRKKGVWQIIRKVNREDKSARDVLHVSLFGGLDMVLNGEAVILDKSSASKPLQLLQMLLHAGGQGVAREVLQESLYSQNKAIDRSNNLKQTVFRLRKMIDASSLPEDDYITIEKSRYYWRGNLPVSLDTARFKRALEAAASEREAKQRLRYLLEACNLYQGSFLPRLMDESWASTEAKAYKKMYYDCLHEVCGILKREERYEDMLTYCMHASRLYPYEEWDLECIDCLIAMEKFQEAQEFYKRTAAHYEEEPGGRPARELLERQALLSDRIRNTAMMIEDIQKELSFSDETQQGAYYCSYPSFEGICHQIVRSREEKEENAVLLLCTMLNERKGIPLGREKLKVVEERLHAAIRRNIRRSDCYTRYSENQLLILLVDCDLKSAGYAQKRIAYYLEKEYGVKSGIRYDTVLLK